MKTLSAILVLLVSIPTFAGTNLLISKDSSKANILMLATTSNPDAIAYNDALAMDAVDENGKWTKRFQFASSSGERLLSVACVFSKLVGTTGSCTTVVYASALSTIDKSSKKVRLHVTDTDGNRLAQLFRLSLADASGLVYRSSDGKMQVRAEGLVGGQASGLEIIYGY